jgi:putative oxidoreductase
LLAKVLSKESKSTNAPIPAVPWNENLGPPLSVRRDRPMAFLSIAVVFAARALLVLLFLPFSALDKILNFKQAVGQASEATPNRSVAALMIFAGLGVEILMSLAILSGIADRMAALILALYCVITALLWKQFWKAPDFRLRGASRGRDVFWDFLKNLALAGGFLALAFGASTHGLQDFVAHPLASSQPYGAGTKAGV